MIIKTFCCGNKNPVGVIEPVFSWKVYNCKDKKQIAYQIVVQSVNEDVAWDSGKVNTDTSVYIKYDGRQLKENTKYLWRVTVFTNNHCVTSESSYFIIGMFDTSSLKWVAPQKNINSPFVYKEIELNNLHEYATVNVCGLGFFELYINGKKVSKDLMSPVRTDYDAVEYKNLKYPYANVSKKSVQYLTYEVSKYLQKGKNTLVVWLGNGWYRQDGRTIEGIFDYGEELKMFLRLTNGKDVIECGEDWLCTESPIVYDNLFYGEVYDSRIEFSTDNAKAVHITDAPDGRIVPQLCPPEKTIASYTPVSLNNCVYDAKICMTGFAEITFSGKTGDKVEIYYAEDLNEEGTLDFKSTVGYEEADKNQIQKDVYILCGKGEEIYCPRFVWHAFRYFKVCAPDGVEISKVKVHYVCTDLKQRTRFECSDKLLNDIHKLSLNTELSNLHGCVPMDCPHRERLGYTGDGQLSSLSMMYNFDAYQMYSKWIDDILSAQNQKTGFVPHTAPFNGGGGGPAWGSSVAIVPWNLFTQYGDIEILKKSKIAIKKWIEYLSERTENGILVREESGSWCLGDWCMPSKYPWSEPHLDEIKIPSELVNTIYYIYCMNIYSKILDVLGEQPDEQVACEISKAKNAVNDMYLDDDYAGGEQGCNVFPLFVGIVPKDKEFSVFDKLITRIAENDFCFDTGISGTCFLLHVLDRYGRNDIAIKMLLNTEYPSFGNMIKNGATALWETWEGNGSKNHTAFSSADSWLFYGLAGIKPKAGYEEFSIKPFFAEELDHLNVQLECEYGAIILKWQRCNGGIDVEIHIPFNTLAHIDLEGDCFDLESGTYKYYIGGVKS